ncbi:MAG: UDP-N-acetylmuramoyl-L-alanyl-D-glutamate--2,6-diaminopimelate ligase [Patescibacteria group bacterium]
MKTLINKLKRIWWALRLALARIKYGDPARKLKIVGVTGTNGKTTTATLLYRIANALGHKSVLISTVEILVNGEKINVPPEKKVPGTTPDSVFLVEIFARAVREDCKYVFMEVSSHALHQNRVAGIDFAGGIFTNLTHDHLDYHGTPENYFQAKKKFFDRLSPHAFSLSNADDPVGESILEHTRAKKYFYGLEAGADFKGKILKKDFTGLEIVFTSQKIKSKLLGKFNAYNLLAVWSAAKLLGFDAARVNKILETIEPPKGRFEHLLAPTGALVIVDYAHSPDALEKVLTAAREILPAGRKLIALAGAGGDRDPLKRPKMGKIVAELADVPIFTSDNPRSEDPEKIVAAMQAELTEEESHKVRVVVNRREAIAESLRLAERGDVILCAGKGHEDYQEIKGVKHHFSDREEFEKLF